jgi:sigma-B regulation protein RsbU (phosphoserine phosphatase)
VANHNPPDPCAELDRCRERVHQLEAVVEASALVNSTLDLKELAEHVVGIATRLIGAERGSLFLVDHEAGTLESLVAQGLSPGGLTLRSGEGIVGSVAAGGEALILDDPYTDPRFDRRVDRITGFRTRSLLTVPVRDREGALVAVLQLLNRHDGSFSGEDVAYLAELGVPFAIALTTARMHAEIVARERMREELRLAAEIQRALQPRDLGEVPGLELATLADACLEVGGDYHDLIPAAGGRWWLVVADISGKGVAAGLIASNVQAYLWSRRSDRRSLPRVVAEGNEMLYRLTRGRKFATLVLVEWDPSARTLEWVSAGHPPLYLGRDGTVEGFEATGRPMGLLPDQVYDAERRTLAEGDRFLLYTDGVLEAGLGSDHGEFGLERVRQTLATHGSAAAVVAELRRQLHQHLGDVPADDDVTVMCGRCLG